jgi:hypothetical protein
LEIFKEGRRGQFTINIKTIVSCTGEAWVISLKKEIERKKLIGL